MSAYLFDIDGTLVKYHTNEWLPGAKELLEYLHNEGHQIIFTTMRGHHDDGKEWSIRNTELLLDTLDVDFRILYNVAGGRTLIDDNERSEFLHHPQNSPWTNKSLLNGVKK